MLIPLKSSPVDSKPFPSHCVERLPSTFWAAPEQVSTASDHGEAEWGAVRPCQPHIPIHVTVLYSVPNPEEPQSSWTSEKWVRIMHWKTYYCFWHGVGGQTPGDSLWRSVPQQHSFILARRAKLTLLIHFWLHSSKTILLCSECPQVPTWSPAGQQFLTQVPCSSCLNGLSFVRCSSEQCLPTLKTFSSVPGSLRVALHVR